MFLHDFIRQTVLILLIINLNILYVKAQILFDANFEYWDLKEVHSVHTSSEGQVFNVANPFQNTDNPTSRIAKFQTTGDAERAEFRLHRSESTGEEWYGWQIYIPNNWQPAERGPQGGGADIITQWHTGGGQPDWAKSHPMVINIDNNGTYHITWNYGGDTTPRKEMDESLSGINAFDDRDRWVHWAFHVNWAKEDEPGGFMKVYHNGKLVFSDDGPNWQNLNSTSMWKAGIYHGNPSVLPTDPYVLYADNFILANGAASINDVNPYLDKVETDIDIIEHRSTAEKTLVYPHPIQTGRFCIKLSQAGRVRVADVQGKIVYNQVLSPGDQNIDISGYNRGFYLLSIGAYCKKLILI